VFLFAAIATPTGDPITMLMLAVPMWLLFEVSVLVARFNDRRRAKEALKLGLAGLDDDEASPLDDAEPIADAEPVDEPTDADERVPDTDDDQPTPAP
jgi:sec-independent protein translocase protein TatC